MIVAIGCSSVFGALLAGCTPQSESDSSEPGETTAAEEASDTGDRPSNLLDFTMKTIDGEDQSLDIYQGDVILVVNVASRCGLTPQYQALEALYREHQDAGFTVLAFPANNFNGQEPGSNEEIREFCTSKYQVTFPMFAKISVLGDDQDPLYAWLSTQPDPIGGEPQWNFTKFLVNREGEVVQRFEPRTAPDDPAVVEAVNRLLESPRS